MEKPKIVSVTDALESPVDEDGVPQLPGMAAPSPAPEARRSTVQPDAPAVQSAPLEQYPDELPPERAASLPASGASLPPASAVAVRPALPSSVPSARPVPASEEDSFGIEPPAPKPQKESAQNAPAPAGSPPWVDRNPPQPTVAEMAAAAPSGPIPTYPGVGRPRINSISQSIVSLEPAKPLTAPIRPDSASAAARSASSAVSVQASSGKLYERPELDAEHFAEDMASHKPALPATASSASGAAVSPLSSQPASAVVQEYRRTASADLKPAAPVKPRTPEEERAHARTLAAQIHQDNQKAGLLGQIKRMFGVR